MVVLVRAGRTPELLAREYEPKPESIRNWVRQANRDEGCCDDGLTSSEREELRRLRRENRQLKIKREIPANIVAWLARESYSVSPMSSSSSRVGKPTSSTFSAGLFVTDRLRATACPALWRG